MSQPAVLELDEFLSPISPNDPVGDYLRWEDAYAELEESRRADEDAGEDDVWKRQRKTADWNAILRLGTELLRDKTKDLQIAAWVAEALARQHGLVGVRDGLKLVAALQEAFWQDAHPARGDLELREGVYEFLDHERLIPLLVKGEPVTYVPGAPDLSYSYMKYEESRKADNLSKRKFEDDDERAVHLAGKLRGEQFDEAYRATDRPFYVDLLVLIDECREVVDRINAVVKERWPAKKQAPQLNRIFNALADLKKLVGQLLAKKPAEEPPPAPQEAEDEWADSGASEELDEEADAEAPAGWGSEPAESASSAPERPVRRRSAGAGFDSAEEARDRIADAAHFLRRSDPSDPTSYLVLRALASGGVFASADELDASQLPPPSSAVREKLVQLARAGDEEHWASCLEEAEHALGRPEGRGWLDLHWYAFNALTALGYENPARACKSLLKAVLAAYPSWPDSELRDGTSTASAAARAWLQAEELLETAETRRSVGFAGFPEAPAPAPVDDEGGNAEASEVQIRRDPWDEAQSLLHAGRPSEALSVMAKAARQAGSGRERFMRALQQAELCIALNRHALALPILEGLAQRVDELHLDQWEDAPLCARVFSNLYRCVRGRDEAKANAAYDRLCRLDIGLALQMEEL